MSNVLIALNTSESKAVKNHEHIHVGTWTCGKKSPFPNKSVCFAVPTFVVVNMNKAPELSIGVSFSVHLRVHCKLWLSTLLSLWYNFVSISVHLLFLLMCETELQLLSEPTTPLHTHIKRRREGKKRVKKQEQMSKILFNSQRQPISITVIYCCCYRFQWHTKSKYPLPKRLSFSFHIHMVNVSKAKLSNIEMRSKCFYFDVAIFLLSLSLLQLSFSLFLFYFDFSLNCCCYARDPATQTRNADTATE